MLDIQQTAYYLTFTAQCWLSVRLEFAGSMIVMCACLVTVLDHATKGGDEHFAGKLECILYINLLLLVFLYHSHSASMLHLLS